jgi:hypothetical protein
MAYALLSRMPVAGAGGRGGEAGLPASTAGETPDDSRDKVRARARLRLLRSDGSRERVRPSDKPLNRLERDMAGRRPVVEKDGCGSAVCVAAQSQSDI